MRRYNLVLLHGQPGTGADWQHVIAMLPEHISAVALDRPGHGSSRQAGGGLDVNAAAVIEELDARGIDRAVLVGDSYGGGGGLSVPAPAAAPAEARCPLPSVGPDCPAGPCGDGGGPRKGVAEGRAAPDRRSRSPPAATCPGGGGTRDSHVPWMASRPAAGRASLSGRAAGRRTAPSHSVRAGVPARPAGPWPPGRR